MEYISHFSTKTLNFTEKEKMLLLSIIDDHKGIIENTKTDNATQEMKKKAWNAITKQYAVSAANNGISYLRSESQLKKCWTNLKYKCRQADSKEKQYQLGTGGGPPIELDKDEQIHEQVRSIVPKINFTLENEWDSTGEVKKRNDKNYVELLEDSAEECNMETYEEYLDEDYYLSGSSKYDDENVSRSKSGIVLCDQGISKKQSSSDIVEKTIKRMLTEDSSSKQPIKTSASRYLQSEFHREPLSSFSNVASMCNKQVTLPECNKILEHRLNKCKENINENTPGKKKKVSSSTLEIEEDMRIKKLDDSIQQQEKVQEEKLNVILKEKEY